MHPPSGMRRRSVPCLGATALLAAGALFIHLVRGPHRRYAGRRSREKPYGTEFPTWERHYDVSKTYYVDGNSSSADDAGPGTRNGRSAPSEKRRKFLQPGERVVIAEGIYREVVRPPSRTDRTG